MTFLTQGPEIFWLKQFQGADGVYIILPYIHTILYMYLYLATVTVA